MRLVLLISLLYIASPVSSLSSKSSTTNFVLSPSCIVTNGLCQSYPVTLLNKLFSSVPKREKAINNISINFGHCDNDGQEKQEGLTLLVGRSASGKSTLLRILAQWEEPTTGTLVINGQNCFSKDDDSINHTNIPNPIIIDSKPDCYDSKSSVYQRLLETVPDSALGVVLTNSEDNTRITKEMIVVELAQIMGFTNEQLHELCPSDLTPSQQYLFGLTQGCLQSILERMGICKTHYDEQYVVPAPILLLDELLDKETSGVAKRVGMGLQNLTRHGGIVIAATHRPQYLLDVADKVVTLSSGKILSVEH